jgi:hypothetical protein
MTDMPVWVNIAAIFVIANLLFHIIYLLDRRTKSEGILFSRPASLKSRIYAGLLAIILGAAFLVLLMLGFHKSEQTVILAITAITLLGYSLGIDKPLQHIQEVYAETFHNHVRSKKIVGIKGQTIEGIISKVRVGGQFVAFEYCISPLIVTLDYESNIHFVEAGEDPTRLGLRYSIISLLFGWESLFGPIHAIRCIATNFRGGRDVTQRVVDWLNWLQQAKKVDE